MIFSFIDDLRYLESIEVTLTLLNGRNSSYLCHASILKAIQWYP